MSSWPCRSALNSGAVAGIAGFGRSRCAPLGARGRDVDAPGLLLAALLCAEVAAVGLAVRRWNDRSWTPLVLLLAFALADELAQAALHAALDGAPRPLAGWHRAGWHVSIALSLGWPAALVLATWATKTQSPSPIGSLGQTVGARGLSAYKPAERRTGGKPSTDFLLGAYLGTLAGLAIVYPPSRAGLRWTLLAWELACVALAWWGLWLRRTVPWGAVEVCLVVLVACESAVVIVGPFASDPFARWWIARCFYLGAWGLVSAVFVRSGARGRG